MLNDWKIGKWDISKIQFKQQLWITPNEASERWFIIEKDYKMQELPDFSQIITRGDLDEMTNAIEIFEEKIDSYLKNKSSSYNISNFDELKSVVESKIKSLKDS